MASGCTPFSHSVIKRDITFEASCPKYSYTWNVSEVLSFIKSLGPNEKLNLKLLSFKLAMLLGLIGSFFRFSQERFEISNVSPGGSVVQFSWFI